MSLRLGQIVDALGGRLEGADRDTEIQRIAPLESAGPGDLAFLSNPRYRSQLAASRAACVIVAPGMREAALERGACIVADQPYVYFARVTVGERCTVGARCILHPGVVIGADGFGFAHERGEWVKIEQLGAVRIGDDVEIGANTCIDRGALDDTVIEDGVKLDNLIQIAHNVHIGRHTAMAGCSAVAGSTRIGAHCTIAGAASIVGHLELADNVHISTNTVVTHSIARPGQYTGVFPMDDNAKWEKNAATLRQLYRLRERIKALEQARKDDQSATQQ